MKWFQTLVLCLLVTCATACISLSYEPVRETKVLGGAKALKTRIPTHVTLLSDGKTIRNLNIGTPVKVLGVYLETLYAEEDPREYRYDKEYVMELQDGQLAYGRLPEACLGEVVTAQGKSGVIRDIKQLDRKKSGSKVPFGYYLEGDNNCYLAEDLSFNAGKVTVYQDGYYQLPRSAGWDLFRLPYAFRNGSATAYILSAASLLLVFFIFGRIVRRIRKKPAR